ncbi:MAG: hypothetical protein AUG48_08190 [Actinobacteria bacterium 13_1_20CM_3_68_9]|nr:MAG: hypothetical protein AUG48_08190 [Actinobacteria bacterium 13_1_20CM_3_68_9]
MRPEAQDIAVPPFRPDTEWIGPKPPAVERICARGPLVVQFVDAAHLSSVRTLPYLTAWSERYRDLGLTLVGVNSPRFPFMADTEKLSAALARLGVRFPVAADSRYEIWHDYGCEGWPSLFLWGRGGALRWFHFGEGEYAATEQAIQEELRAADPGLELPEPLPPLRPSDAPGALVAPPSAEIFPGGSESESWQSVEGGPPLELDYAAGGAWAAVDGRGRLRASLDRAPELTIEVEAPGAYELSAHERHEAHHLELSATPGLRVYSIGFSAGVP